MKLIALTTLMCISTGVLAEEAKPPIKAPVGLQLYSFREQVKFNGVEPTLDKVKQLGFTYVELAGTYKRPADKFVALLKARNLVPIAAHFPYDRLAKEPEACAKEAKELGLQYVGCAWISHKAPFDEKQCLAAAEVFNRAGKVMADNGMKFYYHNHGYEFFPHKDGTLFDLLMAKTDPKLVFFEMDVLWTIFPGQDPAKLLEKYPGRWELTHLKDLKKGVQTGEMTGKTPTTNDVALGTGQMNWNAFFTAANKVGVKYHFIEDESPTVEQQLPESLKFLATFPK